MVRLDLYTENQDEKSSMEKYDVLQIPVSFSIWPKYL